MVRAPCLVVSSSVVMSRVARGLALAAMMQAATLAFMSTEPSPCRMPSATRPLQGSSVQPVSGHRVHVAGEGQAAGPAAMGHQAALRHAGGVRVVQPLDLETFQLRFDSIGDGDVGEGAAAVDPHQIDGETNEVIFHGGAGLPEAGARATLAGMASYIDPRSGRLYPLETPRWCGDDGAPLLVSDLPGINRDDIAGGIRSIWRYAAALPFLPAQPITMGEGCTPLVEHDLGGGATVLLKCEWFMPTGSFKDRGASVMLSLLREQGSQAVLEDSSGNGGAAVSAYAAAGGMAATIFVPASTSAAKTVQSRAVGAAITLVPGSRQDCADAAEREAEKIFYASHNWQAFFLQGTKTLAYELWEDLGFKAPDNVIVPCGAGSNVLGAYIGFSELLRAGQIAKLPRIFAAQPANCAPIARAALGSIPSRPSPPSPKARPSPSRCAPPNACGPCARAAAAR
jgi:threonine synthase